MAVSLWLLLCAAPVPDAISGAAAPVVVELVPPTVVTATDISLVTEPDTPVTVVVIIRVDELGEVAWVLLEESAGEPYDSAVMTAATHFRFDPARYGGAPVAVDIRFRQTFTPPAAPVEPGTRRDALLTGQVREKGTRLPVTARIAATVDGETFEAACGTNGKFTLPVPHGEAVVEVVSQAHLRFRVHEMLAANEQVEVRYLLERSSYNPYETVVIGKRERQVVARTSLRGREIKQVPGTFGDPFHVISTMPGVGHVVSLLAYPIVRGNSPGNTGFLLDGVRVPQLFHMLAGPAVVHPEFIDRVDFYPGSFPVQYGGYIGGIVDGITHRVRRDEEIIDAHVDFTKAGLFVRGPVEPLGVTGTVAARYGYPGLMLDLLSAELYASYWDYQAQIDGGTGDKRWRAFVFGSFDEVGEVDSRGERQTGAGAQFHRIDLSYYVGRGELTDSYKLVLGFDQTLADGDSEVLTTMSVVPRLRWNLALGDQLTLHAGLNGAVRHFVGNLTDEDGALNLDSDMQTGGAFVALAWSPGARWLVAPGIRADLYHNSEATEVAADPRLLVRYHLTDIEPGPVWLKGGVGLFHQPPRFLVPLPGFEELALQHGLLESTQISAGVEAALPGGFHADVQGYFQYMDPLLFDLTYDAAWQDPGELQGDELFDPRIGRSYGVEVLLKHHGRGSLFGWLSYTLSWSDRRNGDAWVPFDFDRRHMLHVVAGMSLPRNWDVAVRAQLQSGRPIANAAGRVDRTAPFYRIDIRIDKRAVWNDWLLDFYIDIINATLSTERLDNDPGNSLRYTLPTLGVRVVI